MKRHLLLVFISTLILPVFVLAGASAHSDSSTSRETAAQDRTAPKKTQTERIAERKTRLKTRLTQANQAQVARRCKATATIIGNVQKRVTAFEAKRPDVYGKLVTRFETLGPRLEQARIDTTAYNQQLALLKQKVVEFDEDTADLKQAVDDLAAMDCAADPEGFVATVRETITIRQHVIQTGREIRTYLRDTFKPTVLDIQKQLSASQEGRQ